MLIIYARLHASYTHTGKRQTASSQDKTAGLVEPASLRILIICWKMHLFAQRCFASSIAFVQIQIAVWIVELTGLMELLAKRSFHNTKVPATVLAAGCSVVCFITVQKVILEEILLVYSVCAFLYGYEPPQ